MTSPKTEPSGEHIASEQLQSFIEAIEAGTRAQDIATKEARRVPWMLFAAAMLFSFFSVRSGCQADARERQLDTLATKLEAIAAQVTTVQATADSTKDSIEVIGDRPAVDLEIIDAPPSASSGPAQPTALVVIRKPRQSASSTPSVLFAVPLPSVPSGAAAPEPKR